MAFFRPVKSPAGRRVLRQRGSAITEFAIVAPCLVLTLFGTVGLGTMLGRYIQATTVCRDLAHMYVDGVDFTQTGSQNVALQLKILIAQSSARGSTRADKASQLESTPCRLLH